MRVAAAVAVGVAAAATVAALAFGGSNRAANSYAVERLVSDGGVAARVRDHSLVNAWGLATEPGGAWWTANEANDSSTVYAPTGRKQRLTVSVAGGPTGVAFSGGTGFRVSAGTVSAPARFLFACEDGTIRGWSPSVPAGWSTRSEVGISGADGAIFRGLAVAGNRLFATDFHNARVDVFDAGWHRIVRTGAFVDPAIPSWYAPFGIAALDGHVFVTYVWRAPVNGNDAPTGGYVDEYDRGGRLVARVGRLGALNAPWGLALAPRSFGRFGGDLLVGNFGDGRINAYRKRGAGWSFDGVLDRPDGRPIHLDGLWGLVFAADGRLFFSSGPHAWRGPTELDVHGLLGAIRTVD